MPNAITKFKKYIDLLDQVYQYASVTSVLDGNNKLVRMGANANEIIIPKMTMDGLADYSRANGYVSGDVTLTNETVTFNYDRARRFSVDAMDNEETAGIAFGQLSSEFIRTKAAPEIDAFRFAQYAGTENILSTSADIASGSGTEALEALIAAQNSMDEAEVQKSFIRINVFCYLGSTISVYGLGMIADNFALVAVFWSLLGFCFVTFIV